MLLLNIIVNHAKERRIWLTNSTNGQMRDFCLQDQHGIDKILMQTQYNVENIDLILFSRLSLESSFPNTMNTSIQLTNDTVSSVECWRYRMDTISVLFIGYATIQTFLAWMAEQM